MKIIILAAGFGTRGSTDIVPNKMIFPIKGEPIICRQIRLLREFGFPNPLIVVRRDAVELKKVLPGNVTLIHTDTDHKSTLIELRATEPYWDDTVLILLGDLVYSRNALHMMLETESSSITVFGYGRIVGSTGKRKGHWCDHGEIYAIKIRHDRVEDSKLRLNALPMVHYNLWNIPLGLNIPIIDVLECKDIDFEEDFKIVTDLVSGLSGDDPA